MSPPLLQFTPGPSEELFLFLLPVLLLRLMTSAHGSEVTRGKNFIAELDFYLKQRECRLQIDNRRKIVQFNYIHLSSLSFELIERKCFIAGAKLI